MLFSAGFVSCLNSCYSWYIACGVHISLKSHTNTKSQIVGLDATKHMHCGVTSLVEFEFRYFNGNMTVRVG